MFSHAYNALWPDMQLTLKYLYLRIQLRLKKTQKAIVSLEYEYRGTGSTRYVQPSVKNIFFFFDQLPLNHQMHFVIHTYTIQYYVNPLLTTITVNTHTNK